MPEQLEMSATQDTGVETTVSNNNAAPEQPETAQQPAEKPVVEAQKSETSGQVAETAKPEFQDPNMQARFTQRMQEFAKKEQEYNAALTKAKAFERILQDKEAVSYLQQKYMPQPQKVQLPEITEEQFLEATTNPQKFKETIVNYSKNIVENMLQEKLQPYAEQINRLMSSDATKALEQDIDDFANSKDSKGNALYPDFWNYTSDIQQYLEKFQSVPLSNQEKLDTAYRLAKYPHLQKETIEKAHNMIAVKKAASMEKGGTSGNASRLNKSLPLSDYIEAAANEIKW
jgi:hypothetical protein